MGNIKIKQVEIKDLVDELEFDVIICSSGYETRASYIAEQYSYIKIEDKVVLSFSDQTDSAVRLENDRKFMELGYEAVMCDKDNNTFINSIWQRIRKLDKDEINVIVDYSSMSRVWIATLVSILKYSKKNIKMFFAYSGAKYSSPMETYSPSIRFNPIPGFNNLSIPDKPTALMIGLGYEKDRAAGLIEYFDAQQVFLFHTENEIYKDSVECANKSLIEQVDANNIISYPLYDIEYTHTVLKNLCHDLSENFRIILAPGGPKPFSIISYFVATEYDEIDIWKISGENCPIHENREPSGTILAFSVENIGKEIIC